MRVFLNPGHAPNGEPDAGACNRITGLRECDVAKNITDLVEKYLVATGVSIFSGKIKCGECGGFFGAKVWHSTDKYRRVIYRCNNKYDGHKCQTPHG